MRNKGKWEDDRAVHTFLLNKPINLIHFVGNMAYWAALLMKGRVRDQGMPRYSGHARNSVCAVFVGMDSSCIEETLIRLTCVV